ncbi:Aste57867_1248 [Aphanomyces stellatus]|uniref:Aste57867_1248 protein n=1 Tax=Aphanomyces stellatus TaxID=120398 RepID=A0A485K7E8_9STRA|nr:hypothetical protein As57867_001247 [Aphanomyces stellatus]VFT78467.1 Aste57867_1248 [Aphanomyces stellatus]
MRDQYDSLESPKAGIMASDKYDKIVGEVSKALGQLNSTVRAIDQKVSLFGTSLDSASSHDKLLELLDKGDKLIGKVEKRIKLVTDDLRGQSGAVAKARSTTLKKLSADFKTQLDLYKFSSENAKHVPALSAAPMPAAHAQPHMQGNNAFNNYHNADQIFAQAQVTRYDEDDAMRREEDIVHINHQLREINAAYKEVDGLVTDQHEVVVQIGDHVDDAQENAHKALEQVQEADTKRGYCACGKKMRYVYIGGAVIMLLILIGVILALTKKSS